MSKANPLEVTRVTFGVKRETRSFSDFKLDDLDSKTAIDPAKMIIIEYCHDYDKSTKRICYIEIHTSQGKVLKYGEKGRYNDEDVEHYPSKEQMKSHVISRITSFTISSAGSSTYCHALKLYLTEVK